MFELSLQKILQVALICLSLSSLACQKEIIIEEPKNLVSMESPERFLQFLAPQNQHISSWRMLEPTLRKSLAYVRTKKPHTVAIARPGLQLTWGQMEKTLLDLQRLLPMLDANPQLFLDNFSWVPVQEGIHYSGYYEPTLKASRTYKAGYYPIYKAPPELRSWRKRGRKYHDRSAIDERNVLAGRGLEIAWAESLVDIYFLQIQGSGRLVYEDGTSTPVNYAAQNGHDYVASGRIMREMGLIENGDVQEQKEWFAKNPQRMMEVFRQNPSYVFFRLGTKGATGAMGTVIEPWLSIATDRKFIPLGSVVAYGVNLPLENGSKQPLRGIGFSQDVGGAIKRNRIDIFTGGGEAAAYTAYHLDAKGPAWVLVSKGIMK